MMDTETLKYVAVILLVLFAFTPVTWQAWRRSRLPVPPMAKHDRKLYRLWRSDPDAYERQYGALDQSYLDAQAQKNDKK